MIDVPDEAAMEFRALALLEHYGEHDMEQALIACDTAAEPFKLAGALAALAMVLVDSISTANGEPRSTVLARLRAYVEGLFGA